MTYDNEAKVSSHPVGGAVGAAIGAAAGAAAAGAIEGGGIGAPVGLPGMVAGVVIGGIAGAFAGKEAAELANPTTEDAYWRDHYSSRPYINPFTTYDEYAPAYHHGIKAYVTFSGRKFDEMEPYIAMEWEKARGSSHLSWEAAKPATRDAYERLYDRDNQKI